MWEAIGVILGLVCAIIATLRWLINFLQSYVEDRIKEYDEDKNDYFTQLFLDYYYPFDNQIKQIRLSLKNTQKQVLDLTRITEKRIKNIENKINDK